MSQPTIDMHIHFGAPPDEESGCYWSKDFEQTAAYYAMLLLTKSLFKKVDIHRVKKHLIKVINTSKQVDKSVLLALDEVYDSNGQVHKEWSHLHVPNKYLAQLASENERVLFGASVHPYRNDWEEELDYCLKHHAVLCKWIPSSQMIDPTHEKCIPFYKKLAQHNLPLLCHAGPEYAIPTSNNRYNEFNNPRYMRHALDQGVTMIIAHCALPYFWFLDNDYQDDFREFLKLFKEVEQHDWKLYADISALTGPLRADYIDDLIDKIPQERFLFSSDYPIPLSEISYNRSTHFFKWLWFVLKMFFEKNPLDKNYDIVHKMGFHDKVYTNASALFAAINSKKQ